VLSLHVHALPVVSQGKLEPDARQALIRKGQQLKVQLEQLEAQLVQVGTDTHRWHMVSLSLLWLVVFWCDKALGM
jgi:hypothetical protein